MHTLKKFTATLIGLLFLTPILAQEKGDLGLIISNASRSQIAIEYRKPINDQFRFKVGATYGERGNYFSFNNGQIISGSDSLIIERDFNKHIHQAGVRFGLERQFGNSMFSIGGDLSLHYRRTRSAYRNREIYLQSDGTWQNGPFTPSLPPLKDPSDSQIIHHYLVPGARLNFNMDIPIGKSFLLNLSAAGIVGLPVYMGATQVFDLNGDFIGSPPSVIDLDANLGIGLRYIIGSNKDKS